MDGAKRRFQNDQERNKANQLVGPGNNAARSSMRPTADNRISKLTQRPAAGNPPAQQSAQLNSSIPSTPGREPLSTSPSPVRGLGPPARTFDEQTQNLQRQVRMSKLLSSPEAQHANTIVSLRNFWNGRDPDFQRGRQVAGILETYAPPD